MKKAGHAGLNQQQIDDEKEGLTMSLIQMVLLLLFGVPLVVACLAFTLCAMWMQMREDQLRSEKQGLAESA